MRKILFLIGIFAYMTGCRGLNEQRAEIASQELEASRDATPTYDNLTALLEEGFVNCKNVRLGKFNHGIQIDTTLFTTTYSKKYTRTVSCKKNICSFGELEEARVIEVHLNTFEYYRRKVSRWVENNDEAELKEADDIDPEKFSIVKNLRANIDIPIKPPVGYTVLGYLNVSLRTNTDSAEDNDQTEERCLVFKNNNTR